MYKLIKLFIFMLFCWGLYHPFSIPSFVDAVPATTSVSDASHDVLLKEPTPLTEDTPPKPIGALHITNVQPKSPVPVFISMPVIEKKKAFFAYLKPVIEAKNNSIRLQREQLQHMQSKLVSSLPLSETELTTIERLKKQFYVNESTTSASALKQLMVKIDTVPVDLVLVQGANESAWGTSRFAQQGFNFFGLWCYKKGCGFVPKQRTKEARHEVAKFTSVEAGIDYYFLMLNRHRAYAELRRIRAEQRQSSSAVTAEHLLPGLTSYSQRGQAYVDELLSMLKTNRRYM